MDSWLATSASNRLLVTVAAEQPIAAPIAVKLARSIEADGVLI
jgi:hypothetical protein